jgi:hypothetical protein
VPILTILAFVIPLFVVPFITLIRLCVRDIKEWKERKKT